MPVVVAGIALIVILAVFVSYGSSQITKSWGGGFLSWFEEQVVSTAVGGTWVASQVLKLTRYLTHSLGTHFAAIEHQGVMFLSGLAQYVKLMGKATLLWPFELSNVLYWLVRHEIPHLVKSLPNSVTRVVHSTVTRVVRVERTIVRFPKLTRAQVRAAIAAVLPIPLRQSFGLLSWLRTHLKALAHLLAHPGISVPFPGVDWEWLTHGKIGRVTRDIQKRLALLQAIVAGVSGVGLLAKAMQRMGINWIRCNNVKKIGKLLCGSPAWIINLLAAGVVEAFIATDLCEFSDLLIKQAEAIRPALMELVDVEDALIGCNGTTKPLVFILPPASLPPLQGVSPLAV